MPPATQEGKNTFGFRLNGEIWIPTGFDGTANLDASYDPTYQGGTLDIYAYVRTDKIDQFISFGAINLSSLGTYHVTGPPGSGSPGAYYSDNSVGCTYNEPQDSVSGSFTITKLDLGNGIVSGTFELAFSKTGCSTISVTEGRFDIRI